MPKQAEGSSGRDRQTHQRTSKCLRFRIRRIRGLPNPRNPASEGFQNLKIPHQRAYKRRIRGHPGASEGFYTFRVEDQAHPRAFEIPKSRINGLSKPQNPASEGFPSAHQRASRRRITGLTKPQIERRIKGLPTPPNSEPG